MSDVMPPGPASAPRKILVIGPEPPPLTGMEMATRALVVEARRGEIPIVRVDTSDADDELGNRARWTPRNVRVALGHLLQAARGTVRRDVGAVYLPIAQEFPALFRDIAFVGLGLVARKPVLVHLHGGKFADFYAGAGRLQRLLVRASIGRSRVGIVLTEQLRPELECVLPSSRVAVVPNGIDLPELDGAGGGERRDGEVHVLFLSSLFLWKGILLFVEAFAAARAELPTLRASIAGDWPSDRERDAVLGLVRELGVEDAITFVGKVDGEEKTAIFRSSDLFCFTSIVREGQPLVVIEAMAAGLPVVASDWPGIADTVRDGETGYLVPELTAEAFAARIVELARDPGRRASLGAAGRERYAREFTQAAFGDRMVRVLEPYVRPDGEGANR
jgi:glycosyltransferase involved in cell wall biosynthesis